MVAGALGTQGCLEPGIFAERVDQLAGIRQRSAGGDKGKHHVRVIRPVPAKADPTKRLRSAFTNLSFPCPPALAWALPMQLDPKSSAGGGCLILLGFILGAAIGIARGEPSLGVLIGVGAGVLVAVLMWAVGRARGGV